VLFTEQGFKLVYRNGTGGADDTNQYTTLDMPQSQYQEVLREEGDPEVVSDNTKAIQAALAAERQDGQGGCSVGGKGAGTAGGLWLLALGFLAFRRRRQA
jgi:MYXO-CTERM domain-containing protein